MRNNGTYPILTADEVASKVQNGQTLSFSGFTPAGAPKAVPSALARHARELHAAGRPFKVRLLTGASSGYSVDEDLAASDAVAWRAPYQTGVALRRQINGQQVEYVDMHLSHVARTVSAGYFGKIDMAVVEATEITPDGRVYLTTSIGVSPTYLREAEKVVIEINRHQAPRLREMADIVMLAAPPHRELMQIHDPLTRIGFPYAVVDPSKVIGIVENDESDQMDPFAPPNGVSQQIGHHVVEFLLEEISKGRIPGGLLPFQAGVGNMANGVMGALGAHPDIPEFEMYTEVFQDSQVDLMTEGKLKAASAASLTVTAAKLEQIVENFDFFAPRIVLRPQEISNHPGIIRHLGVIAMNTVLEADIYGNVNSSHLYGMDILNGVGGSGEFTRNSFLSILMTPSIAKQGRISSIVPMCPHIDSNEHSVQVIVTEQGLADLRGLGPLQRAHLIIERCAHPAYRDYLRSYLRNARAGHIRHDLARCFELHLNLMEAGSMLPEHQDIPL